MIDLFETEQNILDAAINRVNELQNGASCENSEYINLVKAYKSVLRQLRRVTKVSDRTTIELNSTNSELLDKIHYDALTGIYNKRFLDENLNRIVRSLTRSGTPLTVLMLDVDFFKKFNETYGRRKGDECLRSIATAINDSLWRADDFAARCDDDRFVIVLPNTDEKGAHHMANRIMEAVRATKILKESGDAANALTISIGVVTDSATRKQASEVYLKQAAEALQMSKQSGGGKYTFVSVHA